MHLEALLQTAADRIASAARTDDGTNLDSATLDTSLPLTIVGFSKGAVVLNQMVTELAGESQQAFSWGRQDAFVESYRRCSTRKRPPSSMSCNTCDSATVGRLAGSPETECNWPRGQDDRFCDWTWCHEHEERTGEGKGRPKKEPRQMRDLVNGSHQVRWARKCTVQ